MGKNKILFCGTHPNLDSGYANVVFGLFSHLKKTDIDQSVPKAPVLEDPTVAEAPRAPEVEMVLFAFDAQAVCLDRAHLLDAKIISPYRINGEPFGESLLAQVVEQEKPDVVVIYNDVLVVNGLLNSLQQSRHKPSKTVVYLDLVYEYQSPNLIQSILDRVDKVLLFTDHWKRHLSECFPLCKIPFAVLDHGLRKDSLFAVSQNEIVEAKGNLGIPLKGIVVLNLNRNSWRKRWDLTIKSFVTFLKLEVLDRPDRIPAFLYVGCALKRDNPAVTYNLLDVITLECRLNGLDAEKVLPHFIFKGNRHLTDQEVNLLYNSCDIGLNTCSGEGFGLCNFEHGYLGKPQIVSHVGGLKSCLRGAYYIRPTGYQYGLEGIGGMVYDFNHLDIVEALRYYYKNPEARNVDGQKIRDYISSSPKYDWNNVAKKFVEEIDF